MGWMDGITGCSGECTIDTATVTIKNFKVGNFTDKIKDGMARTAANTTINNYNFLHWKYKFMQFNESQ